MNVVIAHPYASQCDNLEMQLPPGRQTVLKTSVFSFCPKFEGSVVICIAKKSRQVCPRIISTG